MLDAELKAQLAQYLDMMEGDVLIKLSVGTDEKSKDMEKFIDEIAPMSDRITVERETLERTPSFSLSRSDEDTGIVFAGVPLGHEFTSFVLALLHTSGRAPKVDDKVAEQVKEIEDTLHFETYVSLTCQVCPEVVQALNTMAVLNPNVSHTMIDGSVFKSEVESKNIMAVPSVYLNGEPFNNGLMTLPEVLNLLGFVQDASEFDKKDPFDVLVVGGGPGGVSAAIYATRTSADDENVKWI